MRVGVCVLVLVCDEVLVFVGVCVCVGVLGNCLCSVFVVCVRVLVCVV